MTKLTDPSSIEVKMEKSTFINIYQTWADRKIFFVARNLKKKEHIFDQVFVNPQGYTVVRKTGSKQRKIVKTRGQLQSVVGDGVNLSVYYEEKNS